MQPSASLVKIIIINNDIYKVQTSPKQQMSQVSHCTITVILNRNIFSRFLNTGSEMSVKMTVINLLI